MVVSKKRVIFSMIALTAVLLVWPLTTDLLQSHAASNVEWGCYQGNSDNNGVVSRPLPASYEGTSLKWGRQMVEDYSSSFTPPLILDGCLYTASQKYVYKIDKETGETVKRSEELLLNVGYGLNPCCYDADHDQIYVQLLYGRIACLDADSLKVRWTSKQYDYTQSLSNITYQNGKVFTGVWKDEKSDGVYFALDAESGETLWEVRPSEAGEQPCGFYWAGAYADGKHLYFGSDDGQENTFAETGSDSYTESAVLYSVDQSSGEILDKVTGIRGDIRSTVVRYGNYLYFASKGGWLCKVKFDPSSGKFDHSSFSHYVIYADDLKVKTSMITASPVVYGGRIYVGAAGAGNQFSADGGHKFAVLRDDSMLINSDDKQRDSLLYTTQIPGYPQAAPLLSTNTGESGKVRLYFTFNAFPGGIYTLKDDLNRTDYESNTPTAEILFRPETEMQQYCISPLCCDQGGTIYLKNDSGYLMAISANKAYLKGISVMAGEEEIKWKTPFESSLLKYELQAPNGVNDLNIKLDLPAGMTASVDGRAYSGKLSVKFDPEGQAIPVIVSNGTSTREYLLHISGLSNNADLDGLAITTSNSSPSKYSGESGVGYDPAFEPSVSEYVSKTYDESKEFLNIWVKTADPEAMIRVEPISNVGTTRLEDGSLEDKGRSGNHRFPIYWVKGQNSSVVRLKVTSPSGQVSRNYTVTLVRSDKYTDIGKAQLVMSEASATLYTKGAQRSLKLRANYQGQDVTTECTWESTNPSVVSVDSKGYISAGKLGSAEIWAEYQGLRSRTHINVDMLKADRPRSSLKEGTYTSPQLLVLSTDSEGAQVHYNANLDGSDSTELKRATSDSEIYQSPIKLGEEGRLVEYRIRAIATGRDYHNSDEAEFRYIIDLRNPEPSVDPEKKAVDVSDGNGVEADQIELKDLPNGIGKDELTALIERVGATVSLTDGSTIPCMVKWDTDDIPYDTTDVSATSFRVNGKVQIPDDIDANGSSLVVSVKVTICEGKVEAPTLLNGEGIFFQNQKIILQTKSEGASILYTSSDSSETQVFHDGIEVGSAVGKAHSVTIKAYAMKNNVKSEMRTFHVTIDRRKPKLRCQISGRKLIMTADNKPDTAELLLQYRKSGASNWNTVTGNSRKIQLTGLSSRGSYEVRAAYHRGDMIGVYSNSCYCYMASTSLKLKGGKKSLIVKTGKVKGASGYYIRYSLKKNMSASKVKTAKTKKITIKRLKKKKYYYVQVAPIKKSAGKIYIGSYGKIKKIKTK